MTDRERLVELLRKDNCCIDYDCNKCLSNIHCYPKTVADLILADGWIRPPCKSGDELYITLPRGVFKRRIFAEKVKGISINVITDKSVFPIKCFGETVFTSREEAEKALAGNVTDICVGKKGGER